MRHNLQMLIFGLAIFIYPVLSNEALSAEQGSETVVADGIGTDLDSAIQNSAENALIQLVGSFVDSEKSIEKQVEIRGAVKEQSKSINSRVSEYSQGTIEAIEVISTAQDGVLMRVTSKVTVRLEAFQAYIRRTALAETTVQQGLFAKVQTKKDQAENLGDIVVGRIIGDIYNLEVIDLKVGAVDVVTDPQLEASARRILELASNETLISIPVAAVVNPEFLINAYNTLEKTAEKGFKGGRIKSYVKRDPDSWEEETRFSVLLGDFVVKMHGQSTPIHNLGRELNKNLRSAGFLFNSEVVKIDEVRLYVYPEAKVIDLCLAAQDAPHSKAKSGRDISLPTLSLRVLDESGTIIVDTLLSEQGSTVRSDSAVLVGDDHGPDLSWESRGTEALTFLRYSERESDNRKQCLYAIDTASNFKVVLKLSDEKLSRAHSIEVGLER